jgi:hypothetical protein
VHTEVKIFSAPGHFPFDAEFKFCAPTAPLEERKRQQAKEENNTRVTRHFHFSMFIFSL